MNMESMISKRNEKVKEWNKSKNKPYYRITNTYTGLRKYVYMCEDMVRDFYGYGMAYLIYDCENKKYLCP